VDPSSALETRGVSSVVLPAPVLWGVGKAVTFVDSTSSQWGMSEVLLSGSEIMNLSEFVLTSGDGTDSEQTHKNHGQPCEEHSDSVCSFVQFVYQFAVGIFCILRAILSTGFNHCVSDALVQTFVGLDVKKGENVFRLSVNVVI
jgi:hypothetical protein